MYLSGMLSDLFGRAIMLAAGGFAIALVQIGYLTLALLLPALLGVQVIRGFGFAGYTSTAMTYTAERSESENRGAAGGLFYSAGSTGQLLGMASGGLLVENFGFATLFIVCALLAGAAGLCFLMLRRRERVIKERSCPCPPGRPQGSRSLTG